MPTVNVADVAQQLGRALDVPGPKVIDVLEMISPVMLVGPDAPPPYGTSDRWAIGTLLDPDAAAQGIAAIVNPNDSGTIVVVDRANFTAAALSITGAELHVYPGVLGLTGPVISTDFQTWKQDLLGASGNPPAGAIRELRIPFLHVDQAVSGLASMSLVEVNLAGGGSAKDFRVALPVVLTPGSSLVMRSRTNDTAWACSFAGRNFPRLTK